MSIRQSSKLRKSINIINTLQAERLELFLERVLEGLKGSEKQIFSRKELKQLENVLNLDASDLTLLIQTCVFLFEQVAALKLRKDQFNEQFLAIGMNEELIARFTHIWDEQGAEYMVHLREKLVGLPILLEKNEWKLVLPLSSSHLARVSPYADLKLSLSDGKVFTASFTPSQLLSFFSKLEIIQGQLDSLI